MYIYTANCSTHVKNSLRSIIHSFHLLDTHLLSVCYIPGIMFIQQLGDHFPHFIIKLNQMKKTQVI